MTSNGSQPRPILVTGSHRTGSTWVGTMLGLSPQVLYFNEPFRPRGEASPRGYLHRFPNFFTYITDENADRYRDFTDCLMRMEYRTWVALSGSRSFSEASYHLRQSVKMAWLRWRGVVPLVKDPNALFSAEWLARTYGAKVLVLVRHPAAFASSLKRANWRTDFKEFLDQPLLLRDLLGEYEDGMRRAAAADIIEQAILWWRIFHKAIVRHRERHPEWCFVRHEDISREPEAQFRALFERFGLEFSDSVRSRLLEHTSASNPVEAPKGQGHFLTRNSAENVWNWKTRLTPAEIERVREALGEMASVFYGPEDW
jgi:hypothetical protein